ncbi:MAG: helix-turn-helix domain-containing protein [Bacteroidales bacterium]|nr:helix-turn-helix domain-containing protein [Bacteroidales bacterium]
MLNNKILLLLALLLPWPVTVAAQDVQWQTMQLDIHSGLSDNCVNDVLVDSRGFLWIGTNAGLDLYDGINLMNVSFPDTENHVRPVVFSLAEDPSGILWAGTSKGLYCIDRKLLEMRLFEIPGLDGYSARQMCCSKSGYVWLAPKRENVVRIETSSGTVTTFHVDGSALSCDPSGAVYIISSDGRLYVSADGASDPECLCAEPDLPAGISRIASTDSHIFLSVEKGMAYAFDMNDREFTPLPFINRMRDAVSCPDGETWIAARDGIQVLDSTFALVRTIRPFHDNSIRCVSGDGNGGIWAGTLLEGLAHISPDNVRFRHYSDSFAGGRFKARDFAETPDGLVWIGTDTRGLLCLDPQNGGEHAVRQFFPGRNVTGLMAEGRKLWVGTIDEDLPVTLIDTGTGKRTAYPQAGKSAYSFCRDLSGRLWIGGKDSFVVGRDKPDGSFIREIFVPCEQVSRIICTSDGNIWIASISGQVFRYKEYSLSTYKIPTSNILTDISEDGHGRVFATSEGGGLWEFNPVRDSFQPAGAAETRLLKIARPRGSDLLWITGAHGMHILNPADGRQLPMIPIDALGIDGFNYSSNFISSDGTLYAGTSDGFISFSARRMSEVPEPVIAPVFSSLHILSSAGKEGGARYFRPASLNIGRSARSFEVNVSPLDYSRFPSKELFWRIDGINGWQPVRDGSFTVYDLSPGRWDLKVKALSISGAESPEAVLSLRVQPPLLLSPGAFLVYLILFLLSIYGISILSDRRAKAKAAREQERKLLESKMEFLTSIAHEIRTPLSLVQIPLEALIRKFSSSPDGAVQENLDIMRRNSLKLTVLINELLDFRKLTDSTFQMHPEFLDIRSIAKDAHRRFLPMFLQEGKSLELSLPEVPVYSETDVRSLGRIFDNLLSNALKYSGHRSSVVLSVKGQDAVVSVENDGPVLPENVREEIFKPFYRYGDSASANVEGTGLGLSTSRQFASLLGGSLTMDDDLSVNRFIFTIPVSSEASQPSGPISVSTKDKSIMVVEDDKDMARVIGDILSESYDILYASNGRQALSQIEAGASPTLVVSDVIMPEMDGIALTKALKGNLATSHIPVILLSAEVPDVFMQESLEGGADAYLEKPFSPKKLRSTVDNLIENRKRIYEFYISSLPSDGELPSGRVSAQEQKFLRSIQEYVSANLHRNITLDDLAEVVCLSPSTLYKKMKDYAGLAPMEYVMKVRLHRAVELLKDDSVSVQDVASTVGFNTHSFFSECFKREFGMTPRQWRLRNVAKGQNIK